MVEEVDIQDLAVAISTTNHVDLQQTYAALQCGSRNHLRAFARNLELLGVAYEAQILPEEQITQILNTAMEQCGRNSSRL